jgi:hypothetical protein
MCAIGSLCAIVSSACFRKQGVVPICRNTYQVGVDPLGKILTGGNQSDWFNNSSGEERDRDAGLDVFSCHRVRTSVRTRLQVPVRVPA